MSDFEQEQLAEWERMKERGIWHFVFSPGAIRFAIFLGIVLSGVKLSESRAALAHWYIFVPVLFAVPWIVIPAHRVLLWFLTMRRYAQALKSK
jgi:hypothetical protein